MRRAGDVCFAQVFRDGNGMVFHVQQFLNTRDGCSLEHWVP